MDVGVTVTVTARGTVTISAIDLPKRTFVLRGPGGNQYEVAAGVSIGLEKLRVGDRLLATSMEAFAVRVRRRGTEL